MLRGNDNRILKINFGTADVDKVEALEDFILPLGRPRTSLDLFWLNTVGYVSKYKFGPGTTKKMVECSVRKMKEAFPELPITYEIKGEY